MSMRTLAATAMLCVAVAAGAGFWAYRSAPPDAPPVTVLTTPDRPTPAGEGTPLRAGLDRFRAADAPKPVPALSFLDGEGRRVDLSDFKDRLVLLNLWATWCGPCVKEMPALDRLQAQLGGPEFQVVALSLDRGGKDQVEPFFRKIGVNSLGMYLDPGSAAMSALGLRGLPTTLLIDQEGREVARLEGAMQWDSPEVVAFLRQRMGHGGAPGRDRHGTVKAGG